MAGGELPGFGRKAGRLKEISGCLAKEPMEARNPDSGGAQQSSEAREKAILEAHNASGGGSGRSGDGPICVSHKSGGLQMGQRVEHDIGDKEEGGEKNGESG